MTAFLIRYFLLMGLAFVLIEFAPAKEALGLGSSYTQGVVWLSEQLILLLGMEVRADGIYLHLNNGILEVRFGCNGLEALLLYYAAVLAYSAPLSLKIWGILLGTCILMVVNLLRIALLAYIHIEQHELFEIMHNHITQSIMIAIAFTVFIFYLLRVQHARLSASPSQ